MNNVNNFTVLIQLSWLYKTLHVPIKRMETLRSGGVHEMLFGVDISLLCCSLCTFKMVARRGVSRRDFWYSRRREIALANTVHMNCVEAESIM